MRKEQSSQVCGPATSDQRPATLREGACLLVRGIWLRTLQGAVLAAANRSGLFPLPSIIIGPWRGFLFISLRAFPEGLPGNIPRGMSPFSDHQGSGLTDGAPHGGEG